MFLATLENNNRLHLYGVAALDTLTRAEYNGLITDIVFECIKFEHIVYQPVLHELLKYKQLQGISLIRNGLSSFVLLSKLEIFGNIKRMSVHENPICKLKTIEAFVAYRFQHVIEFNGFPIDEEKKKIAKQEFEKFDRSLASATLANKKHASYKKLGCSKGAIKNIAKDNEISSNKYMNHIIDELGKTTTERKLSENGLEDYAVSLVYSYVASLEDNTAYQEC